MKLKQQTLHKNRSLFIETRKHQLEADLSCAIWILMEIWTHSSLKGALFYALTSKITDNLIGLKLNEIP